MTCSYDIQNSKPLSKYVIRKSAEIMVDLCIMCCEIAKHGTAERDVVSDFEVSIGEMNMNENIHILAINQFQNT